MDCERYAVNTMVHLAGILAALWLAYVCLVQIGGYRVPAESTTSGVVPAAANVICVTDGQDFASTGRLRIEGDLYRYDRKYQNEDGGTCLELVGSVTSQIYAMEGNEHVPVPVEQVLDPVIREAGYLGWAFVVVALMLIPALIIAMRYDYVHPVGGDV